MINITPKHTIKLIFTISIFRLICRPTQIKIRLWCQNLKKYELTFLYPKYPIFILILMPNANTNELFYLLSFF